jgi:hypothetical protein
VRTRTTTNGERDRNDSGAAEIGQELLGKQRSCRTLLWGSWGFIRAEKLRGVA